MKFLKSMSSLIDFIFIFKGICKFFLHKLILKLAFLGLGWAQVYWSQLGLMPYLGSFLRGGSILYLPFQLISKSETLIVINIKSILCRHSSEFAFGSLRDVLASLGGGLYTVLQKIQVYWSFMPLYMVNFSLSF